jgi:predicted MFS family arabinose efflux permease
MSIGTSLFLFSLIMTSIVTKFYQLVLCQGILFGLGVGMLFYPSLASVSTHFQKYRASALGIAAAGSSLGGVVIPIVMRRLLSSVGFGWTVRALALFSTLGCGLAVLMVSKNGSSKGKNRPWVKLSDLHDPRFELLTAGSVFVALGLFIPFIYITQYAHDNSIPSSNAIYVLAVMNAGGVLGRIAPAFLSDLLGRFNILFPAAFLSGMASLLFWQFSHSFLTIMLFSGTYGFFSGAFISLVTPCIAQISPVEEIGARIGLLYSVISIPSLIGGPIGGAILNTNNGSYTGIISFSGTTVVTGSLFILWARFKVDSRLLVRV